ncbi:MAG TPA: MFS transporter [candidate division Zixibacteria bacterium]|nr:MFS transporter [candidate division Zixibacteria bacterium]
MGVGNRAAVASLILGRIVYAVNWYSLAAVFSFTASELNQNVSGLGLVTATFFVGIGVFQVPGGVLAAKIGPRLTAIYGTAIASLAALLTGFAGNLFEIAVLRFFVGLGMAFVFAPGVTLMARFLRKGSEGLGVGLYNSAFSLGAAIGLSGWAVLAAAVGWRSSLVTGGLLGLFTSVLLWVLVPKDSRRSDFSVELRHLRLVLLDKWLIVLSIAMLGLQAGSTVYSNFMAYYLESVVHVNVGEAGTIASLASLFALASAPFAGRLFDRSGNARRLLLASGVLMAVGVGVAFFGTVYSAILSGVLVGLASGAGFTFGFSAARAANKLDKEYETLAVSWVNSISLFGDFVPPLLYSYLVIQFGYSPAWLFIAVLAFLLVIPIVFPKVSSLKRAHAETQSA